MVVLFIYVSNRLSRIVGTTTKTYIERLFVSLLLLVVRKNYTTKITVNIKYSLLNLLSTLVGVGEDVAFHMHISGLGFLNT